MCSLEVCPDVGAAHQPKAGDGQYRKNPSSQTPSEKVGLFLNGRDGLFVFDLKHPLHFPCDRPGMLGEDGA